MQSGFIVCTTIFKISKISGCNKYKFQKKIELHLTFILLVCFCAKQNSNIWNEAVLFLHLHWIFAPTVLIKKTLVYFTISWVSFHEMFFPTYSYQHQLE